MSKISPELLAKRIAEADVELFVTMEKMEKERKKEKWFYVAITTTIASIAGLALLIANIYPDIDKLSLSIISTLIGISLTAISYFQHKKENRKAMSKILKTYENASKSEKEEGEAYRQYLIDSLKKESDDV